MRFFPVFSLVLVACAPDAPLVSGIPVDVIDAPEAAPQVEAEGPQGPLPPPNDYTLDGPDWVFPGDALVLQVSGAVANASVALMVSATDTGGANCKFGICLDLVGPVKQAGQKPTNASGAVTFVLPVPPVPGSYHFQAANFDAGGTGHTSTVADVVILSTGGDYDGDGLDNGDEVDVHGSDPLAADSDGGGEPDGIEVDAGRDPTDPTDDLEPCTITFDDLYVDVVTSDGDDPSDSFTNISFATTTGYGLIGGAAHGDPGYWNNHGGAPTAAWGLWDFGVGVTNTITFASPAEAVSFTLGETAGVATIVVEGYLAGSLVHDASVELRDEDPIVPVSIPGPVDQVVTYILDGSYGFAYALDDLTYYGLCD